MRQDERRESAVGNGSSGGGAGVRRLPIAAGWFGERLGSCDPAPARHRGD